MTIVSYLGLLSSCGRHHSNDPCHPEYHHGWGSRITHTELRLSRLGCDAPHWSSDREANRPAGLAKGV